MPEVEIIEVVLPAFRQGFDGFGFQRDVARVHIQQSMGAEKWAQVVAVMEFDELVPWTEC